MTGVLQTRLPQPLDSQLLCCRQPRNANAWIRRRCVLVLALAQPAPRINRDQRCTASTLCQPQKQDIHHALQQGAHTTDLDVANQDCRKGTSAHCWLAVSMQTAWPAVTAVCMLRLQAAQLNDLVCTAADAPELRSSTAAGAASVVAVVVLTALLQPSAASAEGIPTEVIQSFLVSDEAGTWHGGLPVINAHVFIEGRQQAHVTAATYFGHAFLHNTHQTAQQDIMLSRRLGALRTRCRRSGRWVPGCSCWRWPRRS